MSQGPRGDSLLQWRRYQSAHFAFWFTPDSSAERNVTALASRLEAIRDATITALNLEDPPHERVQVYLSDMPESGGQQGDGRIWAMGGQQIIAVYLSEGQSEVLERAIVELLMTSSLDIDAARQAMLVDGMLGFVAQQVGDAGSVELNAALVRLQSEGRQTTLADFLRGSTVETKTLYRHVVTSFVSFLFATYGAEAFKRFALEFDAEAPDRASRAAYGKPLSDLEGEWLVASQQAEASMLGTSKQAQPSALGVIGFLRRSFVYLRPYWWQQGLVLLTALIAAVFSVVLPLAFGLVIDELTTGEVTYLWLVILGVVTLFAIQTPATIGREYLVSRVGASVVNDMRRQMFEHLQRLSTNYYARTRPGEITSRFSNDINLIEAALTRMLPLLVTLVVTAVASLVSLFFLQGLLALAVVLVSPIFFIVPSYLGRRAREVIPEQQRHKAMVSSSLQENIAAQQLIQAYSLQGSTIRRFGKELDQLGRITARAGFLSAMPGVSGSLSVGLIQVLALAGGALLVVRGDFGVGALVSFQLLIGGVTGPLTMLTGILQTLLQAAAGMQRVDEFLDERPQVEDAPDAGALGRFQKEIRFEDVNFSYTGEQINLRDLNLKIPAGQSVAFVGPSGSGKSTVLNLIMRFYEPTTGAVTMDGQDLRRITQESLRSQIGAVFQETFLYNASVKQNIRLGKKDATDGDIERAARAAEIHDFIMTLPRGYDTPVGERGGRLSGGQRQRIALARAILYDPAILVLDEPTSALDPRTEAAINATLEKLTEGRTVLTVTHRLASVANADHIVVLERGQVVEQGTHEELLSVEGLYHRLWGQQNGFPEGGAHDRHVKATRLKAIPFFKDLDGALLSTLADRFVVERHAEGVTIFDEGDPGDKLYFVDRGEVEVAVASPTGEERRAALLRDGDYFGEMALLEDVPRTATVRTRSPSILLALDREQFLDLLRAVPDLRVAFERGVEARRRANLAVLRGAVQVGGGR